MGEARIKTWLDIAPAYLDFAIKFLRHPPDAFASIELEGRVSSDLTGILLGGVALSYVLVLAIGPAELAQDRGTVAELVRALAARDGFLLPAVAVLATLATGVVAHLTGKLSSILPGRRRVGLAGSMEDSVNATLGFAGVYVPLVTGAICCLPRPPGGAAMPAGIAVSAALGVFPCVYLPWSLSSTHPYTPWSNAALSLGTGVVVIYLVLSLAT
jgi:hypothetical protein